MSEGSAVLDLAAGPGGAGLATGSEGLSSVATGGGSAPPGQGRRLLRHAPRVVEGASQQHLDMGVEAAELVGGPPGQGIVDPRVDAQQHLLALIAHV
jgi:hypothetical protein